MRRPAAWVALAVSLLGPAGAAPAADLRTERLAALGKLWAAAKYFHPALARPEIDWDQALLTALPRAASARSPEEYADAVSAMLAALQDPATRVAQPKPGPASSHRLRAELNSDEILVITLRSFPASYSDGEFLAELRRAAGQIPSARGVVFDLREQPACLDWDPSAAARWFIAAGFNQRLTSGPLKIPAQRSRIHSGMSSAPEGGSAYFHSAYYVRDGATYNGNAARTAPAVFLVDPSSCLPPIAPALQQAGRAAIVAEGGLSDASLVERHRIELPGGVTVLLRVSELLYEDGTTGLVPDVQLPPRARNQMRDAAMDAALDLLRNGWSSRPRGVRPPAPAYAVPVRENSYADAPLPDWGRRLLAAFRIWAAFEYFFAYRSLMERDWDRVLVETIPKLEQAASARDYVLALAEMAAHSGDSHVTMEGGPVREAFGEAQPPIRTRMIGGRPVVTAVLDPQLAPSLSRGDVILSVDGEDAARRLKRLSRYFAASTPQSLDHILMQHWLAGPPDSRVQLTVQGAAGRPREVHLTRRLLPPTPWRNGDVVRILPGNVGYADLDRLAPQEVDAMFEKLKNTKAIIFDMRGYPRGTGWLIAPRLTDRRKVPAARFRRPIAIAPRGLAGDVETVSAGWDFVQHLPESDQWKYRGRTVLLIDERAMSQAEHLGLFLEAANGTVFIGSRTAGADGDVARFTVPGGVTISFSGHEVRHADGRPLQRVGLVPHLEVKPTLRGIRSGRDEVLEAALGWLGVRGVKLSGVGEAP